MANNGYQMLKERNTKLVEDIECCLEDMHPLADGYRLLEQAKDEIERLTAFCLRTSPWSV